MHWLLLVKAKLLLRLHHHWLSLHLHWLLINGFTGMLHRLVYLFLRVQDSLSCSLSCRNSERVILCRRLRKFIRHSTTISLWIVEDHLRRRVIAWNRQGLSLPLLWRNYCKILFFGFREVEYQLPLVDCWVKLCKSSLFSKFWIAKIERTKLKS